MMPRLWPIGLAISAALVSSPTALARNTGITWSGAWTTAWGEMRLTQHGLKVEGTYPRDGRHIVGTVSGNVFTGRWDDASARKGRTDAGAVVLTMKADGTSFSGRSNHDAAPSSWSAEWDGTCVGGRCLTGVPTTCTKTYVIQPSGEKIAANIKLTELSPAGIARLQEKEKSKYEDYPYTPTGAPETRKENCAGLVFQTLFPGQVQPGNVDPDQFFQRIVQPYGEKVTFRRKGDVVVYRDARGVVKHVAIVESAPALGATEILTKDGDERPYLADFPNRFNILTNDPLFRTHAGPGGRVEFWRLDRGKVRIQEVSSGQCDVAVPVPTGFTLVPGLTKVSNPNAAELTITPTAAGQGIDDHTGKNGGAGNGGDWKVEYHWAVPSTLVPGKTAAIFLQIVVDSEEPRQPNGYQMGALAPDFAQALPCHYPEQSSCSKTFEYAMQADQAGSSQIVVSVHMLSAEVDFTYRPAGK